jgi:hypothetical protein
MAISTSAQNLIDFYYQKIELDNQQLYQLKIVNDDGWETKTGAGVTEKVKIWSVTEILKSMDDIIVPLDSQIVSVNTDIKDLQDSVLETAQQAIAVGCGSETAAPGFTTITVYHDVVRYKGYDYSGQNPFNPDNGQMNNNNVGLGTYNFIAQVAIGTYYGPINECNIGSPLYFGCDSNDCEDFSDTIDELNAQINILRSTRDSVMDDVNLLKEERIKYELQDYAYKKSKQNIRDSINSSKALINFLNNY